jgi:hypothetical protein
LNTWVKIVGVTAIVGAAVFLSDKFNQAKNTFSVKFKSFGLPTVSSAILTVPIDLEFFNSTGITISIADFLADIYIKKNGQWINAGIVQQPIQLQPNLSQKRITPSINLKCTYACMSVRKACLTAPIWNIRYQLPHVAAPPPDPVCLASYPSCA